MEQLFESTALRTAVFRRGRGAVFFVRRTLWRVERLPYRAAFAAARLTHLIRALVRTAHSAAGRVRNAIKNAAQTSAFSAWCAAPVPKHRADRVAPERTPSAPASNAAPVPKHRADRMPQERTASAPASNAAPVPKHRADRVPQERTPSAPAPNVTPAPKHRADRVPPERTPSAPAPNAAPVPKHRADRMPRGLFARRLPLRRLAWLAVLFSALAALCSALTLAAVLTRALPYRVQSTAAPQSRAQSTAAPQSLTQNARPAQGDAAQSTRSDAQADAAQSRAADALLQSEDVPAAQGFPGAAQSADASSAQTAARFAPPAAYQALFPSLYVTRPAAVTPADKTVYLTFDDGPSANTAAILDVLARRSVRAAWFLVGTQLDGREEEVRAIAAAGHTVALHSDTHDYAAIYASPEAYLADLDALSQKLSALTGQAAALVRFPGGSINHYNAALYPVLCAELLRRGYSYFDWNVSAQDAASPAPSAATVCARVVEGVRAQPHYSVVLMHDTKATTPEALDAILSALLDDGYTFAPLDDAVPMVAFGYPSVSR